MTKQIKEKRQWAQTETHVVPFEQENPFTTVRMTQRWHRLPREFPRYF